MCLSSLSLEAGKDFVSVCSQLHPQGLEKCLAYSNTQGTGNEGPRVATGPTQAQVLHCSHFIALRNSKNLKDSCGLSLPFMQTGNAGRSP